MTEVLRLLRYRLQRGILHGHISTACLSFWPRYLEERELVLNKTASFLVHVKGYTSVSLRCGNTTLIHFDLDLDSGIQARLNGCHDLELNQ